MRKMRALSICAVAAAITSFATPAVAADVPADGRDASTVEVAEAGHADGAPHATSAAELAGLTASAPAAQILGWNVPSARSYYLTSSCSGWAGTIRQGAAAWNQLYEGGGTPVECRNSYITDCGGGSYVVGCNWGAGQRIALYMGGVGDGALLAAHEFGHDWYGHSSYQCAGWSSPAHVMAPSICTFGKTGAVSKTTIDR
jgi:opacity protein-like surface antigen